MWTDWCVWCVYRVKPSFSNYSGVVWTKSPNISLVSEIQALPPGFIINQCSKILYSSSLDWERNLFWFCFWPLFTIRKCKTWMRRFESYLHTWYLLIDLSVTDQVQLLSGSNWRIAFTDVPGALTCGTFRLNFGRGISTAEFGWKPSLGSSPKEPENYLCISLTDCASPKPE